MELKMKHCIVPFLVILLSCMLCIYVSAESGFNAGLSVNRSNETAGSFTVTVAHSSVLSEKTPTLCLPCTYPAAQVTAPDGSTKTGEIANGEIRFEVFMGGTYTITLNAAAPFISAQPASATYTIGSTAVALTVTAEASDSGTISYQWYENSTNSNIGGTVIPNATSASYTPSASSVGVKYYYVVVKNTNTEATGLTAAETASNVAVITVNEKVNAAAPVISAQPASATYTIGSTAAALTVTAEASDNGTLSYQWYENDSNSNSGGIKVSDNSAYIPSTATAGTFYYYAVITNTNTAATGEKTAVTTSLPVAITVTAQTEETPGEDNPPKDEETPSEEEDTFDENLYWLLLMMLNQKFDITVQSGEGGDVILSADEVRFDKSVVVTIVPQDGYTIGTVTVNGKQIEVTDNTLTLKNIRKDQAIEVTFVKLPWVNPYSDIPADAAYLDALAFVCENGLFIGESATLFNPDGTMTRAMFVTVLGRMAGVGDEFAGEHDFADVLPDEWYTPYVGWAKFAGITNGDGTGNFGVNDALTIEEAIVFLARYRAHMGYSVESDTSLSNYADADEISGWAADAIAWAAENGIYTGEDGKLNPQANASRAMVAQILYNFYMAFDSAK